MSFNPEAIKKKLAELSGKNNKKNMMWRPEEGKSYTVRFLGFPKNDGSPFKELWFYYGIGDSSGLLTLHQFGKPDPIQELINKLRADESKDSYEIAKKLYPKMRAYGAIVVRGEEDKGVRLWSFGKTVYQDLLNIMLDGDYGDITDPKKGFDIKVTCEKMPGKQFADTKVRARPNPSPLSDDPKTSKEWLDSIPNLDELYVPKEYSELKSIVENWLTPNRSDKPETSRGLAKETSHLDDDDDEVPKKNASSSKMLDDAFADLDDM